MEALAVEISKIQDELGDSSSDESNDGHTGGGERFHRRSNSSSEDDKGLVAECDYDSSSEECLALMADREEVTSPSLAIPLQSSHTHYCESSSSSSVAMSENCMYWCYKKVQSESERLTIENLELAKNNLDLAEKVSKLEKALEADIDQIRAFESKLEMFRINNIELTEENLSYSDVIDRLKAKLAKFSKASKTLDEIQGNQRTVW